MCCDVYLVEAGVDPDAHLGHSRLGRVQMQGLPWMRKGAEKRKRVSGMQVEELKKRIHKELFGEQFPTASPVLEWKAQQKEMVMAHSVQIMLRHNQTEQAAQEMLREKFFLTDAEAKEFMKKMSSRGGREGD